MRFWQSVYELRRAPLSDSIDALRNSLDPLVADAAEKSYFEVDAGFAVGLPERAATSV
jgi:hypothetical protein